MHLMTRNVNTAFREMLNAFVHRQYNVHAGGEVIDVSVVSRPSRNGGVLMIDEPVTITYSRPRERVLFNSARDANPFFHLYQVLWMLAGRNDVVPLAYYASKMTDFSDDGKTLNGAYGYRWRHANYGTGQRGNAHYGGTIQDYRDQVDQLDVIINHLKVDPNSRRAVLQMWNVEDDLLKIGHREYDGRQPKPHHLASRDVCCNLSVMFSLREEHCKMGKDGQPECPFKENCTGDRVFLDMTVTNRSNDLIWGMLGEDFVTFSILQEYVAAQLGVEVGKYHHFTNNLHVYDWNWKPEEWLDDKEKDWYVVRERIGGSDDEWERRMTIPLVRDPVKFDEELSRVVSRDWADEPPRDGEWQEPFFAVVADPMFRAFAMHRRRDYDAARYWCDRVEADDWRAVAMSWVARRRENHERRGKTVV